MGGGEGGCVAVRAVVVVEGRGWRGIGGGVS